MPTTSPSHFTSGELGDLLGVQAWKIARLFELGVLEEPPRVGGRRLIPREDIPHLIDALRKRGWLSIVEKPPLSGGEREFSQQDCSRCGQPANHRHAGLPYCERCRGCNKS